MHLAYLSSFSEDPRVFPTLVRALTDPEPLVRVYAALRMNPRPADKEAGVAALERALGDSAATVRIGAAVALVSMGISQLPGKDGEQFEQAKFYLLSGDPANAIGALQGSLKLAPEIPARYYLAYAKAQQGHRDEARQILAAIPPSDAQYAKAQNLLKILSTH